MYNLMTWYLYVLWNDHHNRSSYHLSPHIIIDFFVMRTFKNFKDLLLPTFKHALYIYCVCVCVCVCSFPSGSDGKESTCNEGDLGSIPGSGRSPGEGNGNPLQYSCLENPMDGGASRTPIHELAKSQTLCDLKSGEWGAPVAKWI